jgi:hypothetical protein
MHCFNNECLTGIYCILALILPKMDKKFSYLQCSNLKYSNEK